MLFVGGKKGEKKKDHQLQLSASSITSDSFAKKKGGIKSVFKCRRSKFANG